MYGYHVGEQHARALVLDPGLASYSTQENKNEQQKNNQKNIINTVLLVGCDHRARNIFTCNCHRRCIFQYACHEPAGKSAQDEAFVLIHTGQKVSVKQNTPVNKN